MQRRNLRGPTLLERCFPLFSFNAGHVFPYMSGKPTEMHFILRLASRLHPPGIAAASGNTTLFLTGLCFFPF